MLLARGEKSRFRFYNISSQINGDKKHYYDILEQIQREDGGTTEWLAWYMQRLMDVLDKASTTVTTILNKNFFWQKTSAVPVTERQTQMLNLSLDGYEMRITSRTWTTLAKCLEDITVRDIRDLIDKNILVESTPGAKRPGYSTVYDKEDLTRSFTDVNIAEENGVPYLYALSKAKRPIRERITELDADRYLKGDLLLNGPLSKYCSHMVAGSKD